MHSFKQEVFIFFLFLHENICWGYSLDLSHRGTSNKYPQYMFCVSKKNIRSCGLSVVCIDWYVTVKVIVIIDILDSNSFPWTWIGYGKCSMIKKKYIISSHQQRSVNNKFCSFWKASYFSLLSFFFFFFILKFKFLCLNILAHLP